MTVPQAVPERALALCLCLASAAKDLFVVCHSRVPDTREQHPGRTRRQTRSVLRDSPATPRQAVNRLASDLTHGRALQGHRFLVCDGVRRDTDHVVVPRSTAQETSGVGPRTAGAVYVHPLVIPSWNAELLVHADTRVATLTRG